MLKSSSEQSSRPMWRWLIAVAKRLRISRQFHYLSARLILFACGIGMIQRLFFKPFLPWINQFLTELGYSGRELGRRRQIILALFYRRLVGFDNMTFKQAPELLPQIVELEGWPLFEAAHARGKGVVLVTSKVGAYRSFWGHFLAMLPAGAYVHQEEFTIPKPQGGGLSPEQIAAIRLADAAELHRMRRRLRQGATIIIVPEGKRGEDGIRVPLLNQKALMRNGFAHLALGSDAAVMPVWALKKPGGGFVVTFGPEYDRGAEAEDRADRVAGLVTQHGVFVDRLWRQEPAQIRFYSIVQYLKKTM